MSIGENIKIHRKNKGLTQKQLADKIGVSEITVRRYEKNNNANIAIFAGACQSYFEAIMAAGANFASSPARILIDFIDPLIVAERIATTEKYKYITIDDIANELRDGKKGISGIGSNGKLKVQLQKKN